MDKKGGCGDLKARSTSRRLAEVQVSSGRCPPVSLAAALNRGLSKVSNPRP